MKSLTTLDSLFDLMSFAWVEVLRIVGKTFMNFDSIMNLTELVWEARENCDSFSLNFSVL
jgi:hypothetical protein